MSTDNTAVRIITSAEFDPVLAEDELPVLVYFTATWCGPCRELTPAVEHFAAAEQHRLRVVSADVDDNPELAARFSIVAMPTLLLFHHRTPVLEWAGPETLDPLHSILDRLATDPTTPPQPDLSVTKPRTVRVTGPIPGAYLMIEWDDDSLPGETILTLPAGARTTLVIQDGSTAALTGLAPDSLDRLSLVRTPVRAEDAETLRGLTGLTTLGLWSTGIDAHGISRLTPLTGLRCLDIRDASTPDELPPDITAAIEALRPQLPHTHINGFWGRADFHALIRAGGEGIRN